MAMVDRKTLVRLLGAWLAALPALRARAAAAILAPKTAWTATNFDVELAGKSWPGVAVRLPDGSLYTACRICPHQGCIFGFETDYALVGDIVGKDFDNPVLFCRCHMSVYDPLHEGRVLNGPAPRPPWRMKAREETGTLTITEIEAGAGEIH
jgi:Rieske Fe-S protein